MIKLIRKLNFWLLPLVMPAFILSICLFQKLRQDSRYGLHPFNKLIVFNSKYYWQDDKGNQHRYRAGSELRGHFAKKFRDSRPQLGFYGEGALETGFNSYLRYICNNILNNKAQNCWAEVAYSINPSKESLKKGKDQKKLTFTYSRQGSTDGK